MNWTIVLSLVAVVIVVGLASYATWLLLALRRQKQKIAAARQKRHDFTFDSVQIIAKAMLNDDCNLSEGVLRLNALLPGLQPQALDKYSAMQQLYQTVMEMPTHEARRALPKNQRMRLDLTRESAEAELEQKIKLELRQLLSDIEINNRNNNVRN
ncbi:DUF2489 domain-containing protein [Pasteurellaceae bacterium USgator11]|nr:DUF2489 domain-containing protein [Pasteurellaceae bacterium UScroc12]TNG96523.1 DUF2489 domain-containing protein [Pasteurellaceae bacterium USgator41]TNH01341.1 DUF2489 domain-containing protein [Pasteurellaceae bacterium USgator11]TNH01452.1 DUF2489 domain-containing protein [Pasteurellaceae bacterium UScroc31]